MLLLLVQAQRHLTSRPEVVLEEGSKTPKLFLVEVQRPFECFAVPELQRTLNFSFEGSEPFWLEAERPTKVRAAV